MTATMGQVRSAISWMRDNSAPGFTVTAKNAADVATVLDWLEAIGATAPKIIPGDEDGYTSLIWRGDRHSSVLIVSEDGMNLMILDSDGTRKDVP